MGSIWAGVDIGKRHHHCVVIDEMGTRLLSRRVRNDESELLDLLRDVLGLAETVTWAVDLADGHVALLATILLNHQQKVLYISGSAVNRAAGGYRGEAKTDAKDAAIIADQARMRRDLQPLRRQDDLSAELAVLTARRADLTADRTRAINRLRSALSSIFPVLGQELELMSAGALVLLTGYQTPSAIRRIGRKRLEAWLRNRSVLKADKIAALAIGAADRQRSALPAEQATASLIQTMATELQSLNSQIADLDRLIESRFRQHQQAEILLSMPGIGPLLGAEFLAATGGDLDAFGSPDRLAGFAGLAPAPRDSGRISGNLHRPRRYHRGLQRVLYTSALISIRWCPESRAYYARKRAESKRHVQAVLALARRRTNVLWALLRDGRTFESRAAA